MLEDAGTQTVPNWRPESARDRRASRADAELPRLERQQRAVSTPPTIAPNGTLTYAPAAGANGSAAVTVQLHDNGGTANGGVDTSAPQTFTITVSPVNDAPSFTKGPDQVVPEDSGARTVANWATAFSPGPPNESVQSLLAYHIVSNSNPSLFWAGPAVTEQPGGQLFATDGSAGTCCESIAQPALMSSSVR